jgi:hypothetical protein
VDLVTTKPPLEKTIENKFVKWATQQGCMCLKLNVVGRRSWPDRLVLVPTGGMLLIEFKRPGGKLSPGQEMLHEELDKIGHTVHVCYSAEAAADLVREAMNEL